MRWAAIIVPLFLSACVANQPVEGVVSRTGERFSGVASIVVGSSGTMEITSNRGAVCRGDFRLTGNSGRGTFRCNDGRTGPFQFTTTSGRSGSGKFLTQPFIFTFS